MADIQYFWRHPLAEQVREEGRAEARIEQRRWVVLRILEWRDIPVPNLIREHVEKCKDLDRLETWAQRALHATGAADLFVDE